MMYIYYEEIETLKKFIKIKNDKKNYKQLNILKSATKKQNKIILQITKKSATKKKKKRRQ